MLEDAVDKVVKLIRYKSTKRGDINLTAVVVMDSIETLVFDELGIK